MRNAMRSPQRPDTTTALSSSLAMEIRILARQDRLEAREP
jgi:hypothetical protein